MGNKPRNPRRLELIALSQSIKIGVRAGMFDSINEGLIKTYQTADHNQFNTLVEWNKQGFKIRKGEKAFVVWGTPRPLKKQEQPQPPKSEEEENEFFPMAYLFSNAQVEKREVQNV